MTSNQDPWKLSKREVDTIEAICKYGNHTKAAGSLYLSPYTLRGYLKTLTEKMRVHNSVRAAVLWTEWKWSQKLEQASQAQKADDIGLSSLPSNSSKDKQTS